MHSLHGDSDQAGEGMSRNSKLIFALVLMLGGCLLGCSTNNAVRTRSVSIVIASNAAPRVQFGAERLVAALKAVKVDAAIVRNDGGLGTKIWLDQTRYPQLGREGFMWGRVKENMGYGIVESGNQRRKVERGFAHSRGANWK